MYFLPRDLHPGAWWIWALGIATAVSRTTNPWLLGVCLGVVCYVAMARRSDAPWALSFRMYLSLAGIVIAMRVGFRVIFGGAEGSTIVLHLPRIPLPPWAAGIQLLGDVSAESLLGGLYDGLRLAAMIVCVGAANALANPKRLLKSLPSALYEVGTAVVVALSVFPQLAESVIRVRHARRLRGESGKGRHALKAIIIPVLEDALDRSLQLAASMDSRGYGRAGTASSRSRLMTGTFMLTGLIGLCVGIYGTLDATTPPWLGRSMLIVGVGLAMTGFLVSGRRVERTRYRPDHWHLAEIVTACAGLAVAVGMSATSRLDPTTLNPSLTNLSWPVLTWGPLAAVMAGLIPAWLTPRPVPPFADLEEPDCAPTGEIEAEPVRHQLTEHLTRTTR